VSGAAGKRKLSNISRCCPSDISCAIARTVDFNVELRPSFFAC